eukprot:2841203-Rhodomonas_salina.4
MQCEKRNTGPEEDIVDLGYNQLLKAGESWLKLRRETEERDRREGISGWITFVRQSTCFKSRRAHSSLSSLPSFRISPRVRPPSSVSIMEERVERNTPKHALFLVNTSPRGRSQSTIPTCSKRGSRVPLLGILTGFLSVVAAPSCSTHPLSDNRH